MKIITVIIILLSFVQLHAQEKYPKGEVRGAWIATVKNIDWPFSNEETSGEQISEMVAIFDSLKAAGINTVYFQVRTECDALYKSSYEPWSYWLTGKQGRAPNPYYDPLSFAISAAHKRGMELQAWFNPYRAVRKIGEYKISPSHVSVLHPNWILKFKDSEMLNPGIPAVTKYIAKIVADVVKRYNIDGVHFDDYFYPYVPHITNQDYKTFLKYKGNFTNINDWRRNNINQMVEEVYNTIKSIKPKVKFGISPFGIVENKYAGTNGFESYYKIYSDPLTWLKDKTVDYIVPQLYWKIGNKAADYSKLLPWWQSVTNGRQLYIGVFSSKFANPDFKDSKSEIENEIKLNRKYKNVYGTVFFSAKSIYKNYSNLADSLKDHYFKYPAIVPTMPWLDNVPPLPPSDLKETYDSSKGIILSWKGPGIASDGDTAYQYIIYRFSGESKINLNDPRHIMDIITNRKTQYEDKNVEKGVNYIYVISALDRLHNESLNNPRIHVYLQ
ncbi:MAG TPA: glycoside hydrolase [Ignavibacteria bacterium]|nr:glycoside hydrolase [Ignavibacteria bacterium]